MESNPKISNKPGAVSGSQSGRNEDCMNKQNTINFLKDEGLRYILPALVGPGKIWYVNGAVGVDDVAQGRSWDAPFDTLAYAFSGDFVEAGDTVLIAPGHTESVASAAGISMDIAGVTVIGLGEGKMRPLFTIGKASTAGCDIDIDAANITIKNCRFTITAVDVTAMIDVNAAACIIEDCEFTQTIASYEAVTAIDVTGGSANACDNTYIKGCYISAITAAGATDGIKLAEVANNVVIEGCTIIGDYSVACVHNPTGKVLTNLIVKKCFLENKQTGDMALELVSACTGFLIENYYKGDTSAALVDPGSCFSYECYGLDAIDESAFVRPAVGTP